MKNLPQVQLNTRVSPQTWTALDEYSEKTGESKASIVDAAIREYLEKRRSSGKSTPPCRGKGRGEGRKIEINRRERT